MINHRIKEFMNMTLSEKIKVFIFDSMYLMTEFIGVLWEFVVSTILLATRHKLILTSLFLFLMISEYINHF